ncbi:hypothetical protein CVV26_03290 [Candidatus Kuenenbacteria bacterium HGW-Kuenenbacteria-1]|uniref:Uncharacterized protein n=1 Tax=Candidatus Kuenenbacteria bacterium HGW-Kuenenbacteria-1 TaxID=2013812 RepID=A0A2N1UMQ9_9BACT|nr:MAG: hypothetical protein CVV26_03290 [Candidatus Kuenenbacteria bacterium HGW-Kuenenbacteria-1]
MIFNMEINMSNKKIINITLFILLFFSIITLIIAKINGLNYALFNRINDGTLIVFSVILIFCIILIQLNIRSWVKYLVNVLLVFILLVFAFIYFLGKVFYEEKNIYRMVSTNNKYEVIIIEGNGGATTAYSYKVLLRELKLFMPKEIEIFFSYLSPIPEQTRFLNDNTIEIFCQYCQSFIVSFDKRTFRTNKKLQFYKGEPVIRTWFGHKNEQEKKIEQPLNKNWEGKWVLEDSMQDYNGTLIIKNQTENSFSFSLEALNGSHTGILNGEAKIVDNNAVSIVGDIDDKESQCQVDFIKKENDINNIIEIETTNDDCLPFHGVRVHFAGNYVKNGVIKIRKLEDFVQTQDSSDSCEYYDRIFKNNDETNVFKKLVGDNYRHHIQIPHPYF